jgi:hypothetical protein
LVELIPWEISKSPEIIRPQNMKNTARVTEVGSGLVYNHARGFEISHESTERFSNGLFNGQTAKVFGKTDFQVFKRNGINLAEFTPSFFAEGIMCPSVGRASNTYSC